MNYFVNENIFSMNSGTEFSAIKRIQLFKKNGIQAKILTRNYNSNLIADMKKAGLASGDVLSMYDYFQETVDAPELDANLRYVEAIDKRRYHIEGVDANESLVRYHGETIAKVHVAPSTVGLVGTIDYFDVVGQLTARDIWDRRGFKSSTQYFHPDGQAGAQIFYNLDGQPKIELTRMNIQGTVRETMWKLLDYKGRDHAFRTENELFTFFMSELAQAEDSVFINDRTNLIEAVAQIDGARGKWQYLHMSHAKNLRQAGAARQVNELVKPVFTDYLSAFDGIITATIAQADEIREVFPFKHVLALPDTFAEKINLKKVRKARQLDTITYLGRISGDKKPVDTVDIFRMVHERLPYTKLEFYGYATPESVKQEVEKEIEKSGLKDVVTFKGYQDAESITEGLLKGAVLLNTSENEAFGMHILEAMNAGLPVVAYDVKYGVKELVQEGQNGGLAPYGGRLIAAQKLVDLLENPELWSEMSKAAVETALRYNEKSAWASWKATKKQIENIYIG
ncbi:MAG: accessory Sec system glycosyltransferase Asp1 [Streptococcaceae bacterium]|jgi:poly(glycerol-phosphate) alpha-glucosyltransferase|nr:accessory Sec system glycosyltransferase Asp1 [Streptococcaceae bacterium]